MTSSGIPSHWAATGNRPGVDLVPEFPGNDAARLVSQIRQVKRPGDVVVASVHWGSNWGYQIPQWQRRFARALIDGGADIVHGHSSHHPRPIEVYRNRLVLYGCGDFVNDYEGIRGYAGYRDDLRLMYLASLDATGALIDLRMAPMRASRMRLHRASPEDTAWLRAVLDSFSIRYGARVDATPDGLLASRPG